MADVDLESPPASHANGTQTERHSGTRHQGGPTVIERDDELNGKLMMKGDGRILGRFQGEIECGGELLVGPEAEVVANVRGKDVTVAGLVRGNVFVTGKLTLTGSSRLLGDARVGALVVQEGAVHRGAIEVHPEGFSEPEMDGAAGSSADPSQSGAAMDRVKKLWGEFF